MWTDIKFWMARELAQILFGLGFLAICAFLLGVACLVAWVNIQRTARQKRAR